MSRKHRALVDSFQVGLLDGIKNYLKNKRYLSVSLERSFYVYVDEKHEDDIIMVPVEAIAVHSDGFLNTSGGDVDMSQLNLHELATIMDHLEQGEYEVDEYEPENEQE